MHEGACTTGSHHVGMYVKGTSLEECNAASQQNVNGF